MRRRELLREKVAIVRKHKLSAAAQFHVPWMLPEPFFEKFPHLRGPRIDHPRRSRNRCSIQSHHVASCSFRVARVLRTKSSGLGDISNTILCL